MGGGEGGEGEAGSRRSAEGSRGGWAAGEGLRRRVQPWAMWPAPPHLGHKVSLVHMTEMCPGSPQL